MPSSNGTPLLRALVVNAVREQAETDIAALRDVPFEVTAVCATCAEAVEALAEGECDLVVVGDSLRDVSMKECIHTLKQLPGGKELPVVAVTGQDDRDAVLDAIGAGCSGYVLRPYSQETLEEHLKKALNLSGFIAAEQEQLADAQMFLDMGDYEEAVEAFEELVAMHSEAKKYYEMGCRYLLREKYEKAIQAFYRAVKLNDLFAEAYEGLSEAFRRKGDLERHQHYLKKAAKVYAEFDELEKVKELFIDVLKVEPEAVNPYNSLGIRLRQQGNYAGAVHAYTQALELTPFDENIHYNLARAHWHMGQEAKALQELYVALGTNEDFPEAKRLYQQIRGVPFHRAHAEAGPPAGGGKAKKDVE
ncbi:MAG: tetratricopeptide repeat protein [Desulfovibrio sp.]|nr:MAG: tetratricopeptide repeat protein [Desulfovibrio sp.]